MVVALFPYKYQQQYAVKKKPLYASLLKLILSSRIFTLREGFTKRKIIINLIFNPSIKKTIFMNTILHRLKLPLALMMLFCTVSVSLVQGQTWTGAVSSDWNTAGNWTGGVPVASSSVTINAGFSVYPVLSAAGACKSITLGSGASISGTGTLTIATTSPAVTTTGIVTISCPISLSLNTTFTVTGQLTISNTIGGTGSAGLTKAGSGNLIFGSAVTTLNRLAISSGSVFAGGDLTINVSLSITGVLDMGTNLLKFLSPGTVSGSSAGQLRTANKSSTPITFQVWFPKVVFNSLSGGQTIPAGGYNGGLQMANTSGVNTAGGDIPTGTLEILNAGTTLNMNNFNIQASIYSIAAGATLDMGLGALTPGDFTLMFGTVRFSDVLNGIAISSGTVEYYGADQTVVSGIYKNLVINQSSGNATLDATDALTVNGMLTLSSGTLIIGTNTLVANGGITRTAGNLGGISTSNLTLGGTTGNPEPLYFDPTLTALGKLTLGHTAGGSNTTLNTPISIYSGIVIGSSNDILDLNNQNLVLKSSFDSTAYIGQLPTGSLVNATNVTAERFIPAKRSWRLLTIPVTGPTIRDAWAGATANGSAPGGETAGSGTLITGNNYTVGATAAAAGYDWFSGLGATTTSSIRFYNAANIWASATNTPLTSDAGNSKEGFMLYVRGDRTVIGSTGVGSTTLKPTGTIKQGTIPVSVSAVDAFTVVGNPYPAPINLNSVYTNTGNNAIINRNFTVWDARAGTSGAYTYLNWDGVNAYTLSNGFGTTAVDQYLTVNSGQAFFVEKNAGGSLSINESNKVTDAPAQLFRPVGNSGVSKIGIKLYKAVGSTLAEQSDEAIARYNDIYKQVGTEIFDAAKLNNFNENLSLVRDNRYLSIESRPFPTQNDTLYIPFWNLAQRDYAFEISSSQFIGINQTARLIDAFTNTEKIIDLLDGTITYPFSVTSDPASSSLTRFKIVMAPAVVLAVNCTKFDASLVTNKVKLSWSTGCEVGATNFVVERSSNGVNFDEIGSVEAKNSATGASYQLFDNQPVNGRNFYRIRSNDKAGHFAYTSIALIQLSGKQSIQVIPTVIDNKHFTLTLNQQPVGKYNLSLSNVAGQQVFQTSVNNTGLSSTHQIDLSSGVVPKGIYHLSVSDEQGNKKNIRLLINN
jgi:hypothetical protein